MQSRATNRRRNMLPGFLLMIVARHCVTLHHNIWYIEAPYQSPCLNISYFKKKDQFTVEALVWKFEKVVVVTLLTEMSDPI